MLTRLRNLLQRSKQQSPQSGLRVDRPLVLFQSDDWGRAGVCDRDAWQQLRNAGINMGERPYDSYSLETADDLHALSEVLRKHRDSAGRSPSLVMNFITANVDFDRCVEPGLQHIPVRPLTEGLPGRWHRPSLFDAYRDGVRERLFFPALHGLTHFCQRAVARELAAGGERSHLLQTLWRAHTSYIHWRMPWIGYEYWDPEMRPAPQFLPASEQQVAISRASAIFRDFFAEAPLSACAPGYRANADTRAAWFATGVRVVQNGPGERRRPALEADGTLFTFRTAEMEPATGPCDLQFLLEAIAGCFTAGIPAVISVHSINFHSTIRDFRTPTLRLLDDLLTALETKWPNLLYVHDGDLLSIATEGAYCGANGRVTVRAAITKEIS
jgi:hypothetical protein